MEKLHKKHFTFGMVLAILMAILFATPAFAGWEGGPGHWWWRNSDGSYPHDGAATIDGVRYVFDSNGYVKENAWTQMSNGKWYYSLEGGAIARNQWVGDYYLGSDGYMLVNTVTPDGYNVGADGRWIGAGQNSNKYQEYWYIDGDYDNRDQTGYRDTHRVDMHVYLSGGWDGCIIEFALYDITGTGYNLYDKYNPNGDRLVCSTSDGYNWTATSTYWGDTYTFTYDGHDTIKLKWRNTTWGGGNMTFKRRGGGGAG